MGHLSSRLREERERLGMNQEQFAEIGGAARKSQMRYESGERSPDAEYLVALARSGVDVHYIITGKRDPNALLTDFGRKSAKRLEEIYGADFEPVARYDVFVSAGNGAISPAGEPVEHLAFSKPWLRRMGVAEDMGAILTVTGDSMAPTLSHGDIVLVDRNRFEIVNGRVYAFIDRDHGARVKRLRVFAGSALVIQSDNSEYPDEELVGDAMNEVSENIIGEVIWSAHTWQQ